MQTDKFEQLRQQAEKLVDQTVPQQQIDAQGFIELTHELQVHQIELDLQNEELRDTQLRLEETMNKYFELYEFAPIGYMTMDDHGVILTANLHVVKMLGVPRSRLLNRAFGGFVDPMFQDEFFRHLRNVFATATNCSCELAIVTSDQSRLFMKIESSNAGKNKEGKKILRAVIMDITELNKIKRELNVLNTGLEKKVIERTAVAEHRLTQLKKLSFELIRAEQRERLRLAELLHDDLQQLLVGCQMNISFLRKGRYNHKKTVVFETTSDIIKTAIQLSRSLSYDLCPPVLCQGGLPAAFNWLKENKKTSYDFDVHLEMDPTLPRLPVEIEIFFFQCAKELLLNVIKHAKITEADFSLHFSEGRLTLSVSDNGVGCDPGALKNSPQEKKGYGLFNIKNRLEMMDGSFEVHSANKGFTVTLILPISDLPISDLPISKQPISSLPAVKKHPRRAGQTPLPKVKKASITVLLVDDHRILRKGIRSLLEMEDDITVIAEAENGLQAVEMALFYKPDVVLMDIGLPLMNGIEATAKITHENHNIHVIGLSVHESEGFINQMIEAGASRYLTKTVPAEVLIQAIRTVATKTPTQQIGSSG